MNHDEVLSKLKDIHGPIAPLWWPPAPGYVLVLIASVMAFAIIAYVFGNKKRLLKKTIWQEFMNIESDFRANGDCARLQASLNALVRRLVFTKYPELERGVNFAHIAPHIQKIMPGKSTEELISLLEADRFTKNPVIDAELLLHLARRQIKRCQI